MMECTDAFLGHTNHMRERVAGGDTSDAVRMESLLTEISKTVSTSVPELPEDQDDSDGRINNISIDLSKMQSTSSGEGLETLGVNVYSQKSFETQAMQQIESQIKRREQLSQQNKIEALGVKLASLNTQLSQLYDLLHKSESSPQFEVRKKKGELTRKIRSCVDQIEKMEEEKAQLTSELTLNASSSSAEESVRERKIRLGEITPFDKPNDSKNWSSDDDNCIDSAPKKTKRKTVNQKTDNEKEAPSKKRARKSKQEDFAASDYEDEDSDVVYETDYECESADADLQTGAKKRSDVCETYFLTRRKGWEQDRETMTYHKLPGGLRVPGVVWDELYKYQQTGVKWLWEIHQQQVGGILGDEMGLGKTVQVIAFLAALHSSPHLHDSNEHRSFSGLGPVVIVCPSTIVKQWVSELHKWWPPLRVAALSSGGGDNLRTIRSIVNNNGVLVSSYSTVRILQDALVQRIWHYIFLDEGHAIRNPNAEISLAVKRFKTNHRIILSGSPIQNNLRELWSIFDFVYPGKLGTLPAFEEQFSVPITQGGYTNATQVQVQTGYRCACVLKDTISPYLLRRVKDDVKQSLNLPEKNEQVLFCRLSHHQRQLYRQYLQSSDVAVILTKYAHIFKGISKLRSLCNHPDIFSSPKELELTSIPEDGNWQMSGKMIVIESLLKLWKKQKHRVLLFTQSRQMLRIFEKFLSHFGYSFLKMDGLTTIGSRQALIEKFNTDDSYFVFLLTTKVGGLGVNLVGADRVVIYDPDWNPGTDAQARERAWRIGQLRNVTIYRLVCTGTIEEKIYHRQIFKQFLTNKILKDPKQRRFFQSSDLHQLFTLDEDDSSVGSETTSIFAGTGAEISSHKAMKEGRKADMENRAKRKALKKEKNAKKEAFAKLLKTWGLSSESEKGKLLKKKFKNSLQASSDEKIDGTVIKGLVKRDSTSSRSMDEEPARTNDDSYILAQLFKGGGGGGGIQGAIQHDVIEQSAGSGASDWLLVEHEAQKVAEEAVRKLQRSREQCQTALDGIPNWTGSRGAIRLDKPRFGQKSSSSSPNASSASVLARIRERNLLAAPPSGTAGSAGGSVGDTELLAQMRMFIAFQASELGQATTDELIGHFGPKVGNTSNALFRALLKQICNKTQLVSGDTLWVLKPQFRS